MAFVRNNWDPVPSTKGIFGLALYQTTDTTATVEGAGYFNAVADDLRPTCVIIVVSSDETNIYAATVSGAGVVLLITADAATIQT